MLFRSVVLCGVLAACSGTAPEPIRDDLQITTPPGFGDTTMAFPASVPTDWWKTFADPRLDAFMELALDGNRDLRVSLARLEALAAARTIAGAPLWPAVDAALNSNRARRLFLGFPFGAGGVPSTTVTTYGLSLNVTWELDIWGRLRAGESAAIADQQQAIVDFQIGRAHV